jgi:hypothetical protein
MIQALEETFPSEIAMHILKFCRHPTAQMIKDAYIENNQLAWIDDSDDEEDDTRVRDWSERTFNFGKGRCIRLDNESYNYEERLIHIKYLQELKDEIVDYGSDSDCESEYYRGDVSDYYAS